MDSETLRGMSKGCIYPDCKKTVMSRGLCKNHYSQAASKVKNKKTTWEELESAGKILPKQVKEGDWFLERTVHRKRILG